MDFGGHETLNDEEYSGKVLVGYELMFSFASLSHLDLTIAFAFGWHFYLVLYIIVGVLALINMAFFATYHRIVARAREGQDVP